MRAARALLEGDVPGARHPRHAAARAADPVGQPGPDRGAGGGDSAGAGGAGGWSPGETAGHPARRFTSATRRVAADGVATAREAPGEPAPAAPAPGGQALTRAS